MCFAQGHNAVTPPELRLKRAAILTAESQRSAFLLYSEMRTLANGEDP